MSRSALPEPGRDVDAAAARFVVRVLAPGGRTAGVGVLVGPQHILTCAHVVNVALGRADLRDQTPPADSDVVGLDFPLLAPSSNDRDGWPLTARVGCWVPPPTSRTPGDDVAGLVLRSGPPEDARPAKLARTPWRIGRPVRVFGYPGIPPRPDGAWVQAQVQGRVGGGLLQVDVAAGSAMVIQPGFSGSPMVDETTGRVVGLIATAPEGKSGQRDSRGLTVTRLVSAWPQLLGSAHGPGRGGRPRGRSEPDSRRSSGPATGPETAPVTVLHVSDPQSNTELATALGSVRPCEGYPSRLYR